MKQRRNAYKVFVRKPEGGNYFDYLGVYGKMILSETGSEVSKHSLRICLMVGKTTAMR
jgi:hypothetical protein